MPVTTNAIIKENDKFVSPYRMIISGSSGAGKTYFAGELIRADLFLHEIDFIYYFHPCYLDEPPVNWHETMSIPVSYQTGLPNVEQLTSMPPNSLIVLDDLMEKCVNSEVIDHLFRVISGKRKLSVMIMSQNYFTNGRFSRNIRNSCNYSVLMRNCCDATINTRAARAMNLTRPVALAEQNNSEKEYPYIFIDQTQKGQVSSYQISTDIYGDFKKCYSNAGMPSYIIAEKDFLAIFDILQQKNRVVLAQQRNVDTVAETAQHLPEIPTEQIAEPAKSSSTTTTTSKEYSRRSRKRKRI